MPDYVFHNDYDHRPDPVHVDSPAAPEPYIASPQLKRAVNLAIYLRRPLLLEGEVGCGKTRLAYAVAYELGLPLYRWFVRSTSKADEGLYTYDAVSRLHDVQTASFADRHGAPAHGRNPANPADYLKFGPLGQAFRLRDYPAVVLIDEVDKASYDFPNDLLNILDRPGEFFIPETGEMVAASEATRPIVIITSNREKRLPPAFTRRCIYTVISLQSNPGGLESDLMDMIVLHYKARNVAQPDEAFINKAIKCFLALRADTRLMRKPGISEFLDWIQVLHNPGPLEAQELIDEKDLPHPELLLKQLEDQRLYAKS